MNKLILLAISILALFLTSCSDINNEVWINEDGSGKIEVSMDMGEMLGMIEMMGSMAEEMDEEEGEDSEEEETEDEEEIEEDALLSALDGLSDPSKFENMDTSFNFYDVMPDSIKNTTENSELLKKLSMAIKVNKEEMEAMFKLTFEYDSAEERDQLIDLMGEFSEKEDADAKIGQFKEMMRQYDADLEKGIVKLAEQDFSSDFAEDMGDDDMDFDNMSEEDLGMMQMMLGDAGYVTTMHFPSDIISCDDDEAKIYGKTIIMKDSYMDMMKGKKMKARTIKFKVD